MRRKERVKAKSDPTMQEFLDKFASINDTGLESDEGDSDNEIEDKFASINDTGLEYDEGDSVNDNEIEDSLESSGTEEEKEDIDSGTNPEDDLCLMEAFSSFYYYVMSF